jgi:hypothetical protein
MAEQFQTGGYQERLQGAMRRRGMSVRRLHAEISGRYPGLRGASYGGVRLYVSGDKFGRAPRRPREELLRAFADVLAVRFEWLAFGRGARTEAEQEGTDEAVTVLRLGQAPPGEQVASTLAKALGRDPPPPGGPAPSWLPAALILWGHRRARLPVLAMEAGEAAGEASRRAALGAATASREIGRALVAPLQELGIPARMLSEEDLSDYVLAMAGALAPIVRRYPRLSEPEEEDHG